MEKEENSNSASQVYSEEALLIRVDSHEPESLITLLQQSKVFEIGKELLSCGDIQIGDLGIERKTTADFGKTLKTGKLFRQLILLKRSYRRRLLVLEGDLRAVGVPSYNLNAILLRISGSLNIPIVRTHSIEDTAAKTEQLAAQILLHYSGQLRERSMSDDENRAYYQVFVLAGIPGIGITRARALLQKLGSLKAVFDADVTTLSEVPGIGPVHAERIAVLARFEGG